jgi:hypothetical protein
VGKGGDGEGLTLEAGGLSPGHLRPPALLPGPRTRFLGWRAAPGADAVASWRALAAAVSSASSLLRRWHLRGCGGWRAAHSAGSTRLGRAPPPLCSRLCRATSPGWRCCGRCSCGGGCGCCRTAPAAGGGSAVAPQRPPRADLPLPYNSPSPTPPPGCPV